MLGVVCPPFLNFVGGVLLPGVRGALLRTGVLERGVPQGDFPCALIFLKTNVTL